MSLFYFDQLKLFDNLTPAQNVIVRQLFFPVEECAGAMLFNQGDPANYLYIVVNGEVLIHYKPDDGPLLTVARIKPEGVVGWSAALGSPNYTSSAICSTDCQLLRISSEDLRDLCERYPETGAQVLERLAIVIAERMRNTHVHVMALLEQGLRIGINKPVEAAQLST
jgi:CRP/FNR family cyclic AMP-dependent transcriptional regulator